MTIYRGVALGLLAVIAMALIALLIDRSQPARAEVATTQTREDKLGIACEANPADCMLMKRTRTAAEAEMDHALRFPTPEVKASVDEVEKTLRDYEDRFIATGRYGD